MIFIFNDQRSTFKDNLLLIQTVSSIIPFLTHQHKYELKDSFKDRSEASKLQLSFQFSIRHCMCVRPGYLVVFVRLCFELSKIVLNFPS